MSHNETLWTDQAPLNKVLPVPDGIKGLAWKKRPGFGSFAKPDLQYEFKKEILQEALMFLNHPEGDSWWIYGPTGCGKTSAIEQIATRLNWPLFSVTGYDTMESESLVGMFRLVKTDESSQPTMEWLDGPLVEAAKKGGIFLFNEIDQVDPGQLAFLNDLLEGKQVTIKETGEHIQVHPMFRFIATANSNGTGDDTGNYAGVQAQNVASMDRYLISEDDYMAPEAEQALLSRKHPDMPDEVIKPMVELANSVRSAFKGENPETRVSIPFSTRALLRWARMLRHRSAGGDSAAFAQSLDHALLRRARPEDRQAVHGMAKAIFGEFWAE